MLTIKKFSPLLTLFSLLISLAITIGNKIVFRGNVYNDNYLIKTITFKDIISFFLIFIISYTIIFIIEKIYIKFEKKLFKTTNKKSGIILISFTFLFIVYIIYFMSFFPGGLFADTYTSLSMLLGNFPFTNHHPVLYTLSLHIVKFFYPNLTIGLGVYTFIQILFMISTITYFIYWLLNKNINKYIIIIVILFFAFFNLYPLYSISIWKDTPFSLALFLYILTFIDIIYNFNNNEISPKNIFKFTIFTLLVIFLRNNGIYITFFSLIILLLIYRKKLKTTIIKNLDIFMPFSISSIILAILIMKSYPSFGIEQTSVVESLAIPIQQVANVVVNNGEITPEQKILIEKILPIADIEENYFTMIVDKLKWNSNFNEISLNNRKLEYLKLYIELFIQNPQKYIEAYLLQTSGFWSFNVNGSEAYVSIEYWADLPIHRKNLDLFQNLVGFSLKERLSPKFYFSGGFFFWITVTSMVITARIADKKFLLAYVPSILLWITVMIATPMAVALRYVYILILILPLNVLFPFIAKNSSLKN